MSDINNNGGTTKGLLRLNKCIKELFVLHDDLTIEDKRELLSIAQLVFLEENQKLNVSSKLLGTDEEFAKAYKEIIRPKILLIFAKYLGIRSKEYSSILSDYTFSFPEKAKINICTNDFNAITIARKFVISSEEGREKIFRFLLSMMQGNTILFGPNNISVVKIEQLYNYLQRLQIQYPCRKNTVK
jgi:hypothetical protein